MTDLQGRPVLTLAAALLGVAPGCGDSGEMIEPKTVTVAEAKDYYGMNAGSCYRYRLPDNSYATVTIEANDKLALTEYNTMKRSYVGPASSLAEEQYFDFETKPGEVRLLREVTGFSAAERSTKTFVEYRPQADREGTPGPAILVIAMAYDRQNVFGLVEAPYVTTTTPIVSAGGTTMRVEPETHEWSRLGEEPVVLPDGTMSTATLYNWERPGGLNARYALVPGFGFSRIQDFNNVAHQLCAARVCKADGTCTGAASCQELNCQ